MFLLKHLTINKRKAFTPNAEKYSAYNSLGDFPLKVSNSQRPVTILFASHSGNSEFIAQETFNYFKKKKIKATCTDLAKYKPNQLIHEELLVLIISTHGEGNPPESADRFYNYIFSNSPNLQGLRYSICALGDSSYTHFCKTGKDIDERFIELGAKPIMQRVDCDVQFREEAVHWIGETYCKISSRQAVGTNKLLAEPNSFEGEIVVKYLLNKSDSEKHTWHFTLKVEDNLLKFEPGDCIAIYPINPYTLVDRILLQLGFSGNEPVNTKLGTVSIGNALSENYEITSLNVSLLRRFYEIYPNPKLELLLNDTEKLKQYLECNNVLDFIIEFPCVLTPQQFILLLSPLNFRLYSIASSLNMYPNQIDILVRHVQFIHNGRLHTGAASEWLCKKLNIGDRVKFFIKSNSHFRLPKNTNVPLIMFSTGTGIAPFRAFLQERNKLGAKGKNWLFFGNRNFKTDYLYQHEIEQFRAEGILHKLDLAFSRDTENRKYIHHLIDNYGEEILNWIENGAFLYLCGLKRMAADIRLGLQKLLENEKNLSASEANQFIIDLQLQGRYYEDVY